MANNNYQLISYDFNSIKTELFNLIKTKSEWVNVSENDKTFDLFLTLLSYGESFLFGAINNEFINSFPHISAAEEAIYMFADFIKMPITRRTSAIGKVKFSIPAIYPKNIIIPVQTEVSIESGDIIFNTEATVQITAGTVEVEVDIIQGIWKIVDNTSDGSNYQQYFIYSTVEYSNIIVETGTIVGQNFVTEIIWDRVDNFFFSINSDNHYIVKNIKNGIYILFSDGVFGAKPVAGKVVRITYLESLGENGNVLSANLVTKIIDDIFDIDGTKITNITVTNDQPVVNGDDGDSLDDIKRNVTRFFITNPYITRKVDYVEYLLSHPEIIDVIVFAGWEIFTNINTFSTVYIYTIPEGAKYLTTAQKEAIYDFIRLKDYFATKIEFVDSIYIGNFVYINIKFNTDLSLERQNQIKDEITVLIENYYDFQKSVNTYGTVYRDIYQSDISCLIISNVEEVRKVNISIESVEDIDTARENILLYSKTLNYTNIKLLETSLYTNNELIGNYDASWNLVPVDNSGTGGINWIGKISSNINFTTKSVSITIIDTDLVDSGVGTNIIDQIFYVRSFSLNDDDILRTKNEMVFEYYGHSTVIEV